MRSHEDDLAWLRRQKRQRRRRPARHATTYQGHRPSVSPVRQGPKPEATIEPVTTPEASESSSLGLLAGMNNLLMYLKGE